MSSAGRALFFVLPAFALAAAEACSEDSSDSAASDAGTGTESGASGHHPAATSTEEPTKAPEGYPKVDASRGPGGDAGCGGATPNGEYVSEMLVAEDPPARTGGTVAAGTYDLTAVTWYAGADADAGPTGESFSGTWVVTAGAGGAFDTLVYESHFVDGGTTNGDYTDELSYVDGGTSLERKRTCPSAASLGELPYSTDGGVLELDISARAWTFKRR